MSIPHRNYAAATFLVTAQTHRRQPLFQIAVNAQAMLETLQHYRLQGLYKLHAFVVMPDHIHLLITTDDLSKAMQHIKGGFSHRLPSKFPIWQKGFTDHRICDAHDFETRRNYVLQNPIRAHLALTIEAYPYSSAYKPS